MCDISKRAAVALREAWGKRGNGKEKISGRTRMRKTKDGVDLSELSE